MKPGVKEVWYQCHQCGHVMVERPENLECPVCWGNMERRSNKKHARG